MPRNNHAIQKFFGGTRPRPDYRRGGRRPFGDRDLFGERRGLRLRSAVDRAVLFSPDGGGAVDVLAPGHGHRPRSGRGGAPALFALGAVGRLPAADCGQRDQHRRRPGRHGGSHRDGHRHTFPVADAGAPPSAAPCRRPAAGAMPRSSRNFPCGWSPHIPETSVSIPITFASSCDARRRSCARHCRRSLLERLLFDRHPDLPAARYPPARPGGPRPAERAAFLRGRGRGRWIRRRHGLAARGVPSDVPVSVPLPAERGAGRRPQPRVEQARGTHVLFLGDDTVPERICSPCTRRRMLRRGRIRSRCWATPPGPRAACLAVSASHQRVRPAVRLRSRSTTPNPFRSTSSTRRTSLSRGPS